MYDRNLVILTFINLQTKLYLFLLLFYMVNKEYIIIIIIKKFLLITKKKITIKLIYGHIGKQELGTLKSRCA
jgi:hypothetical protein